MLIRALQHYHNCSITIMATHGRTTAKDLLSIRCANVHLQVTVGLHLPGCFGGFYTDPLPCTNIRLCTEDSSQVFRTHIDFLHMHIVKSTRPFGVGSFVISSGSRTPSRVCHPLPTGDPTSRLGFKASCQILAW